MNPDPQDDTLTETPPSARYVAYSSSRPLTEIEALMTGTACGHDVSHEERHLLRERLVDVLEDELSDEELWVFDALFVRQLSLRKAGAEIGLAKTSVWRLRNMMVERLRERLVQEPLVVAYLEGRHAW